VTLSQSTEIKRKERKWLDGQLGGSEARTNSVNSRDGNIVAHHPIRLLQTILDRLRDSLLREGRSSECSLGDDGHTSRRQDSRTGHGGLGEERHCLDYRFVDCRFRTESLVDCDFGLEEANCSDMRKRKIKVVEIQKKTRFIQ
jgi:hypothetical protein